MKNQKKKNVLLGGSIIASSIIGLGTLQANTASLFEYNDLGSGSELRANLLDGPRSMEANLELKCGEGKCGEKKSTSTSKEEGKSTEAKCGEKSESKEGAEGKAEEGKATEHKCGEGKCGEGKCGGAE